MRKFLVLLLSITSVFAFGQEVISSSGNTLSNGGYSIDFTIGEPIIATLHKDSKTLTQGYHQPSLAIIEVKQIDENFNADVFPNPATSFINIEMDAFEGVSFKLQDLNGKILDQQNINQSITPINVKNLERGIYLLKLVDEKDNKLKSYKFLKH